MSGAGIDFNSPGEWLRDSGPERDVVISTRVRLARNLKGFRFTNSADRAEQTQLVSLAREHATAVRPGESLSWIDLLKSPGLDRSLLVERHLISKQHAKTNYPRGVIVSGDESLSIMVNEEDHYRMQVIRSGLQLHEAFGEVDSIDDRLGDRVEFAFHKRFGYLTACPTNVGTGIRVSVMLHLPALTLTNEIERVRRAARDMQLAIRGFYGEGSDALGDFYQISNQTTLGKSEADILREFEDRIIPQVINYERQARRMLTEKRATLLDDRCFRALGVLQNARILKADESMRLLSHVRLGIETGRIDSIDSKVVCRLFLFSQSAHLQKAVGRRLDQARRAEARASLIREALNQ
ncbi:MAG: protein arginine kinase [Phycisphaerales bacterium]